MIDLQQRWQVFDDSPTATLSDEPIATFDDECEAFEHANKLCIDGRCVEVVNTATDTIYLRNSTNDGWVIE